MLHCFLHEGWHEAQQILPPSLNFDGFGTLRMQQGRVVCPDCQLYVPHQVAVAPEKGNYGEGFALARRPQTFCRCEGVRVEEYWHKDEGVVCDACAQMRQV
jgi:hypothetical protein